MFPNPQTALPLPSRPSVERYKKIAKELVKICKSKKREAIRGWAEEWVASLVKLSGLTITPQLPVHIKSWVEEVADFAQRQLLEATDGGTCTLAGAQFVIARSHGFESWPKFAKHLESLARSSSAASRFEASADAIVSGDLATLKRLLGEEPKLIRARSTREHGATLLHYVSANGIEGYRQKTPKNIVEIAEVLLGAGAEIDATANVYGGACTTLGLVATSVHPERAGVQEALLRALLESGASIEQPSITGKRQSIVTACLANGRVKAAEFFADRGTPLNLTESAALGRIDMIKTFFADDSSLKPGVTTKQLKQAFLYACGYGRNSVIEFLIGKGADPAVQGEDGQTGLHWAVIGGHLDTLELLLGHHLPLEVKNIYGGTVFGQALWSAAHDGDPDRYLAILERLFAAGAKIPERHVAINKRVDEWLERHGSHREPA
jgi:hypothetical protein